jgi:glycine cleavage system aminomethyltransferase T
LQTVSTQSPYVREGRVRHTLFLREDATVLADAFVVAIEDGFFVFAEGPTEEELVAWLASLSPPKTVAVRGMGGELVAFGVDGPYAWEVVAGVLGRVVVGMPYLTLLRRDDAFCLRAGKTGEYGYLVVVPRASAAEYEAKIAAAGGPIDLARVSLAALDVCALENWHFSMRNVTSDIARRVTPIELQLQWRVVYARSFVGADALRKRRDEGVKTRVTCFTSPSDVPAGTRLRLGELDVGEVAAACASPTLAMTVGCALLEKPFAHPHLVLDAAGASVQTVTASLVNNASLRVQPHKHGYATREAP